MEKLKPAYPSLNPDLWRSLAAMDQTRRQAPPTTSTRVPSKSILSRSPTFKTSEADAQILHRVLTWWWSYSYIQLYTALTSNLKLQMNARDKPFAHSSILMLKVKLCFWRRPGIPTRHSWWTVALWALWHGSTARSQTFVDSGVQTLHMKWVAVSLRWDKVWRSEGTPWSYDFYDLICARLSSAMCSLWMYYSWTCYLLGEIAQQKSDCM